MLPSLTLMKANECSSIDPALASDHPVYSTVVTDKRNTMAKKLKHELQANGAVAHTQHTDFASESVTEISGALTALLVDVSALYMKTKNFHWHMSDPHLGDYHFLLDDHGDHLLDVTDEVAERVRKIGGTTFRSPDHIARPKRIATTMLTTSHKNMLSEVWDDNNPLCNAG